jgi:hypothetical protein
VKQELPHTRERMGRNTYRSYLKMKKEYGEIGDQLKLVKKTDQTVFGQPKLDAIFKQE